MKRLLLNLLGIMLVMTVSGQANIITNGDFETGDQTGWNTWGNGVQDSVVYEGSYSGIIKPNMAGSFLVADQAVVAGAIYKISLVAKWPDGIGTANGIQMIIQTPDKDLIGGTGFIKDADWTKDSALVTIPDGMTSVRVSIWKPKSPACFIDNVVMEEYSGSAIPDITMTDDGEIMERAEEGEVITVSMSNDVFADPLVPENWTVSNLPIGVTVGAISRVSDTQATITLSGNATTDYDIDITNFSVEIAGAEFASFEWSVAVNTGVTFTAIEEVVTEELIWEEDFSTWTPDVVLDSAYLASMDFRTQGAPDSIKVIDGIGIMYSSDANSKNNWIFKRIQLIPGASYVFSLDLRTPVGKTRGVVWDAQDEQVKGDLLEANTEFTTTTIPFTVGPDKDTVELGVYKWGATGTEANFDNWKLSIITDPLIQASSDGEILAQAEDGEVITVTAMYDTYVASPNIANWSATGLPEGVSLGSLSRVDDTTVEITLAGNATTLYEADSLLVITASADEFEISEIPLTAYKPVVLATTYVPPVETASITFIVDDSRQAAATGFAIKGSWLTATGEYDAAWDEGAEHSVFYDDGTNGDAAAGDNIWTVSLDLVSDGGANTWEWGVNDSEGNWIDGNFQFTVVDGTAQTLDAYVILNNDATLSSLSLDVGTLDPAFDAATTTYTAEVPSGTTSVTVSATTTDANATLTGDGAIDVSSGSGTVSVTVTAEDGVTTKTYTVDITVPVGIEHSMADMIQVYPNPVMDQLNITAEENISSIRVFDLLGNKVFEATELNERSIELQISDWKSGVYLVNILSESQYNTTVKVVK